MERIKKFFKKIKRIKLNAKILISLEDALKKF